MFGAAALAQIVTSRTTLRRQLASGMGLLAPGLVVVTAAVWTPSLPRLLARSPGAARSAGVTRSAAGGGR